MYLHTDLSRVAGPVGDRGRTLIAGFLLTVMSLVSAARGAPRDISFSQSAQAVEAYDFVEVTINVDAPDAVNPFTEVTVSGEFGRTGGPRAIVDGFCDSADGRVFRIRFMPATPGEYT